MTTIACEPWMQLIDGTQFFLLKPKIESSQIDMIARVLSRIPRFGGHSIESYSVAQHCVIVHDIARRRMLDKNVTMPFRRDIRLAALLHDAHEAFVGDMTSPMKSAITELIGEKAFREIDSITEKIDVQIAKAFGFATSWFYSEEIKYADLAALATEKRDLMVPSDEPWIDMPEPEKFLLRAWPAAEAEDRFLQTYHNIASSYT